MKLSASSIATFKACPFRYYYQYVLGLVPIEDTESQRVGTNWHRIQQIASMKPGSGCECGERGPGVSHPDCVLCCGSSCFPDDPMDAVIRHLNETYKEPPISKTVEEWETERIILLYSLIGYQWLYQDEGYEVESLEQKFSLPLLSPLTGRKLKAELRGKIDRIFSAGLDNRFVHEYKSTSKSLDPDSTYWGHLTLDTQTKMYTYAAQRLDLGLCGILYDVWHKPGIRPKKLSQAESKRFVAGGEYMGEKFAVTSMMTDISTEGNQLTINGKLAEIEPGAKEGTFAIRETPEMFGARLLQDITTRSEFYFARKEIVHHQDDIKAFEHELFNIYHSIRLIGNKNTWFTNEAACEATFRCSYIDFCYNNMKIGPEDVPDNFQKLEIK